MKRWPTSNGWEATGGLLELTKLNSTSLVITHFAHGVGWICRIALKKKKAIINMKNEDDKCFKWLVTRALNPISKNPERGCNVVNLTIANNKLE